MRCAQRHTFISPMKVPCAFSAKSIVRFRGGDRWPGARRWGCRRQSRGRLRPLSSMRKHGARNEGLPKEILVGEEAADQRVAGINGRSVMLGSGRYAMQDDGMGFSLAALRQPDCYIATLPRNIHMSCIFISGSSTGLGLMAGELL